QTITIAQTQIVPENAYSNFTFSDISLTGTGRAKIACFLQLCKKVDAGLNTIKAATGGKCGRVDSHKGIIGLTWITINTNHIFVIACKQFFERGWGCFDDI